MTKPITDKAEVALEYPDKLYVGTFERSSRFEAHLDPTGIALERPGAVTTFTNRFTCTSTLGYSLTYCESWLQRLAAFRRMTSCIAINSRKPSRSCTPR